MIVERIPVATAPGMAALSRLPVFFALDGKRAVVAGGTAAAAWKAELLSAAGARVEVFTPAPGAEMAAVAGTPPRGPIEIHRRDWATGDIAGAAIAVADCADDAAAAAFTAAAGRAGVPVNVVDRPAFSDFAFGAIVNRTPLVIGISTDGAAPVFAQAIRARIETLIPKGFARWAEAARAWRPRLGALAPPFRDRRGFWEKFTARALAAPDRAPDDGDLDALLGRPAARESGSVVMVGAGPGDPELLTLRAVRALQSADVILFDAGVATEILDFARREARKLLLNRTEDCRPQLVAFAGAGRRVVRLISGDPAASDIAVKEVAACRAAGIAVEIVPGIMAPRAADRSLDLLVTGAERASIRATFSRRAQEMPAMRRR